MGKQKMFALLASVFAVCMTAGCSIGIGTQPRVTPSSSSQTNPLQGDDSPIPAGLEDFYRQKAAWTGCSETDFKNYQMRKSKGAARLRKNRKVTLSSYSWHAEQPAGNAWGVYLLTLVVREAPGLIC